MASPIAIKLEALPIAGLIGIGMLDAVSIYATEVGATVTATGFPDWGQKMGCGVKTFEPTVVSIGSRRFVG